MYVFFFWFLSFFSSARTFEKKQNKNMLASWIDQVCASARDKSTDEDDAKLLALCKSHVKNFEWSDEGPHKYTYVYDDQRVTIDVPNDDCYTIQDGDKKFVYKVEFPSRKPNLRTWDKSVPDSCRLAIKMCQTGWSLKLLPSPSGSWASLKEHKEEKNNGKRKREEMETKWMWMYEDNGWESERWHFAVPCTPKTAPLLEALEKRFAQDRSKDIATKRKAERNEYDQRLKYDMFGMRSVDFFDSVEVAVPTYFGLVKDWLETTEQVDQRVSSSNSSYMAITEGPSDLNAISRL